MSLHEIGLCNVYITYPLRFRYVFFTDWSDTNPRIGRSALDGSQVVSIVSSPTVIRPNAVTLYREVQLLYFGDAGSKKIYSVSYDGTNLKLVANVSSTSSVLYCHIFIENGSVYLKVPNVFDLALSCSKEYLYFTDWSVPYPRRIDLSSGNIHNIPVTSQQKYLFGLCSFCDNCSCKRDDRFHCMTVCLSASVCSR